MTDTAPMSPPLLRPPRRRWIVAAAVVAAALIVTLLVASRIGRDLSDPAPWCVWAAPNPGTFVILMAGNRPSVTGYTDPSSVPGGGRLPPKWSSGIQRRGLHPAEPTLWWVEPRGAILSMLRRPRSEQYLSTCVERAGPDGRTWLAFVRSMHPTEVSGGAPDPRCAGTWEITDETGAVTRVELRADGSVRRGAPPAATGATDTAAATDEDLADDEDGADTKSAEPGARWLVRDGALVIIHPGPDGIDVGVLADDAQSFAGRHDQHLPIQGKRLK